MNSMTTSINVKQTAFPGVTVHAWSEAHWEPMVLGGSALPGFHWWPLTGDEQGAWEAYWMRVDPGARSALHVHPATELLHIHEGVLIDEDGRAYEAGDTAVFAAGSRHFTHSPNGCHALVVTSRHAAVLATGGPDP